MKNCIVKDLFRWYGEGGESLLRRMTRPPEMKFLISFRKAHNSKNPFKILKYYRMSHKTGIQIPPRTQIGEGFYIGHFGRLIIHPDAKIGKNVNVATGVTIGRENRGRREGVPTVGDEVWIGTNAVLVGNIKIGNDVLIAPLSFVNFDVPDHSIVIGNPAKVIARENATKGYIDNKV